MKDSLVLSQDQKFEKSPRVTIIIVNYNGAPFLKKLLSSLEKQTYKNFEIVFVDNASKDKSIEIIKKYSEKVTIKMKTIILSQNLGFCKGNNIGLKFAEGEYIVLLNNDTFVSPTWLEELVEAMDYNERIGVCQSKIINMRDKRVLLGNFIGVYGMRKNTIISSVSSHTKKYFEGLFYASGASLIIRKSLLSKLGYLFDEKQFTGDLDLSWRVRLLGYKIVTNIKSLCFHYQGYSTKIVTRKRIEAQAHSYKDRIRTFIKNYSLTFIFKRVPILLLVMFLESIYLSLIERQPMLYSFIKGIVWNILNFGDTWREHLLAQSIRVISDEEIERYMLLYPAELYFWRLKIRKTGKHDFEKSNN